MDPGIRGHNPLIKDINVSLGPHPSILPIIERGCPSGKSPMYEMHESHLHSVRIY